MTDKTVEDLEDAISDLRNELLSKDEEVEELKEKISNLEHKIDFAVDVLK